MNTKAKSKLNCWEKLKNKLFQKTNTETNSETNLETNNPSQTISTTTTTSSTTNSSNISKPPPKKDVVNEIMQIIKENSRKIPTDVRSTNVSYSSTPLSRYRVQNGINSMSLDHSEVEAFRTPVQNTGNVRNRNIQYF